jgi:hypothetical protein
VLAWIHPDQAKARKAIAVPLNDTALQVVRELKAESNMVKVTAAAL